MRATHPINMNVEPIQTSGYDFVQLLTVTGKARREVSSSITTWYQYASRDVEPGRSLAGMTFAW